MRSKQHIHTNAKAFVLLEVILALALFSMISVGITGALKQIGESAFLSGEELRVQRKLESWLTRYSKADFNDQEFRDALPIEEIAGEVFGEVPETDEMGVDYYAIVEELEEMYTVRDTEDQQAEIKLNNMYRIRIEAIWGERDSPQQRVAETIRYASHYQKR
ncbi:MAG: hypothetical protein VX016_10980 [Verrucomicrobiota bacterium]|nr:hypothetical protein [Verrucomicrobiota bacterium]